MAASVDVIVPIFNGERFINTLVENFERQTFLDFRVIFVDDGSTDKSIELLDESLKSANFSSAIVRQINKGLPSARNAGLKKADADWVVFVDCDDVLHKNYLKYLYEAVIDSGVNVGVCDHVQISSGKIHDINSDQPAEFYTVSSASMMMEYYVKKLISPCTTIIKLSWLEQFNLFFDENCPYLEDGPFMTGLFAYSNEVTKVRNVLYYYISHGPSLVTATDPQKYLLAYNGFLRMENRLKSSDNDAIRVFFKVAHARYLLIILRRAARQLSLLEFRELSKIMSMKQYSPQIKYQPFSRRIAARSYLISPQFFYFGIRASI